MCALCDLRGLASLKVQDTLAREGGGGRRVRGEGSPAPLPPMPPPLPPSLAQYVRGTWPSPQGSSIDARPSPAVGHHAPCTRAALRPIWTPPPPSLCGILSFVGFLTGPWIVTRSSLCKLLWVVVAHSPARPVCITLCVYVCDAQLFNQSNNVCQLPITRRWG